MLSATGEEICYLTLHALYLKIFVLGAVVSLLPDLEELPSSSKRKFRDSLGEPILSYFKRAGSLVNLKQVYVGHTIHDKIIPTLLQGDLDSLAKFVLLVVGFSHYWQDSHLSLYPLIYILTKVSRHTQCLVHWQSHGPRWVAPTFENLHFCHGVHWTRWIQSLACLCLHPKLSAPTSTDDYHCT